MERVVTASPHHKLATADRGRVEEGQGRRGEGEGMGGEGNEEWMTGKGEWRIRGKKDTLKVEMRGKGRDLHMSEGRLGKYTDGAV